MPRNVFLFDPVERFVAGTVGQPGERSFYLQARGGNRTVSVLVEKDQVLAIATRLAQMLRELKRNDQTFTYTTVPRDDLPLENPIDEEFRAGAISLAWLADRNLILLELQAVESADASAYEIELEEGDAPESSDLMRVFLSPGQTEVFVDRALAVVNAGRPPCPFCGLALDPRGHLCPRANGYRR